MGIIVVSGLPRSGTSLMMQMLAAAGIPVLTDGIRKADRSNPKGYYEWEPIKRLAWEPQRIHEAEGKSVKVVSSLLMSLPKGFDYQVIFLERGLREVTASQRAMIESSGGRGPLLSDAELLNALAAHRRQVDAWLMGRDIPVLRVVHDALLREPGREAGAVARFLRLGEEEARKMEQHVDPSLWHQRAVLHSS